MSELIYTIIIFIITFSILVFIHELGHYLAAIACKVKVEVFSVGFGNKLFEYKDKRGTIWRIASIPLGGFVSMKGEMVKIGSNDANDKSNDSKTGSETGSEDKNIQTIDQDGSLETKNLWQKSFIAFAGPLANWLFCFFIFIIVFKSFGVPSPGDLQFDGIGGVVDNYPAQEAGFQPKDIITKINQIYINDFTQLSEIIAKEAESNNLPLQITVLRENQELTFEIIPINEDGRFIIGVLPPLTKIEQIDFGNSIYMAFERSYYYTKLILMAIIDLFKGLGLENLGGPIKIAKISASAADQGLSNYLIFLALFSLNLAILNLLPIPVLDGGHLLYFGLSAIFTEKRMQPIAKISIPIGIAILVALTVFVIIRDIITF